MTAIIQAEKLTKFCGQHRHRRGRSRGPRRGGVRLPWSQRGRQDDDDPDAPQPLPPDKRQGLDFGIDVTVDPVAIHRRLGYLPGEFVLYDKLTGGQTIQSFANLRGGVDPVYQAELISRLEVDPTRKFKEYSKGNKQKIGLVVALQHRPDLLLLDEPTSGLDPLVQQTFYDVIREAKADGRTIFMSSHILSEVEKTCDRVAIIRDGQLSRVDRVEALRDIAHHQVELRFASAPPVGEFEAIPGVSEVVVTDHTITMRVSGPITPVVHAAARHEVIDFVSREPSLEETFLAEYGRSSTPAEVA